MTKATSFVFQMKACPDERARLRCASCCLVPAAQENLFWFNIWFNNKCFPWLATQMFVVPVQTHLDSTVVKCPFSGLFHCTLRRTLHPRRALCLLLVSQLLSVQSRNDDSRHTVQTVISTQCLGHKTHTSTPQLQLYVADTWILTCQ